MVLRASWVLVPASCVQELPVSFITWESNVFTVEDASTLAKLYSHHLKATAYPGVVKKAQLRRDEHIAMLALRVRSCRAVVCVCVVTMAAQRTALPAFGCSFGCPMLWTT
jgi:hypothetical protein